MHYKLQTTNDSMLPKTYDPKATEDRIYKMWEESGAFHADPKSDKEPFTISLPPPNATGQLHVGNAMMIALEDIFIRFQRMRGKEVLWVPGTDHAAIATESFVIRKLQKEGKMRDPRQELGREKLLQEIHAFVENSKNAIRGQIRKMGASCDWSREHYTMEPALNRIVNEVFVKMYRDGLIYRGHRIVNWDPTLQTTVSDDEIVYEERKEPFYTFQYGPFQISTSRPETKFGDKYVVMHPDDERYAQYTHGETVSLEWINGPITATIVKDKAVDPAFGTGVMTITPWHDHIDFDLAERHKLEKEQIIGFDGRLLPIAGEFSGMPIEDARPKIVEKLKEKGLLVSIEEGYVHNVALSQRGKGMIEPQIKEQWFIDVNRRVARWKRRELSLKDVMQEVVNTGLVRIIPDRFMKTYFHWIDHLRDWCISRQIWWGHRVPVWYCVGDTACLPRCKEPIVSVFPPQGCPHCTSKNLEQDPDTLDTWFSSALWTWSTLVDRTLTKDPGVPLEEMLLRSPDFRKFHPTDVLETGYDILFFWVARMILMTTYVTGSMPELEHGQVPFDMVYLHGLIRDREGRKMSKTYPETNIDPIDVIGQYGADALRLAMIVGQSPGNDFCLYEEKIAGYRNFVNKLWNASRFVLLQCKSASVDPQELSDVRFPMSGVGLSLADRALLSALQDLIRDVTEGLEKYRLSEVGERLYSFVWDYFCDWYLELSKGAANTTVLVHVLRTILTLLHPYCPFVTEELWSSMKPKDASLLLKQEWPVVDGGRRDQKAYDQLQVVIDVVTAIRRIRADHGIAPDKNISVIIHSAKWVELLESQEAHVRRLAHIESLTFAPHQKHTGTASALLPDIEIHVPLAAMFDREKEREKLMKERDNLLQFKETLSSRLSDQRFLTGAPADIIQGEKERLAGVEGRLQKINETLQNL